jgi:hypothetical protein
MMDETRKQLGKSLSEIKERAQEAPFPLSTKALNQE